MKLFSICWEGWTFYSSCLLSERWCNSVNDTGILEGKRNLSAFNRSQTHDLLTSTWARYHWTTGELWWARLSTRSMETNFLYIARIGMYVNISYQLFKVTQSIYIKKLKQEPKLGSELNWGKTSMIHMLPWCIQFLLQG